MTWSTRIATVTKKANGTLAFLRRNLRRCPPKLKETANQSPVRSLIGYSSTIWNPYLKKDIKSIEAVQQMAAQFVKIDYSSVTNVIYIGLESLETRR